MASEASAIHSQPEATTFAYEPPTQSKLLRLLKVLPDKVDDRIQVQLWQDTSLTPYRCLSYT